jgi:DNA-binding HxlR family transcriptional regulator
VPDNEEKENSAPQADDNSEALQPLMALATALLDTDRLRIAGLLAGGPANPMQLEQATGISHRDLLRHLDSLQNFGIVKLQDPAPRDPDHYSPYELNAATFKAARQAMGKYKGVRKRPTDSRELTLETFMPDGKLTAFPLKQAQLIVILDTVAARFEADKQYSEREINMILADITDDFATLRRYLVDYGYLSRTSDGSVYHKN